MVDKAIKNGAFIASECFRHVQHTHRRKTAGINARAGYVLFMTLPVTVATAERSFSQEAQLSPSDRAMRLVSSNLANYHATVQKLLIRQVLTKPMAWS